MAPLDRSSGSKPTERSSHQRNHVVVADMEHQVRNQRRGSPAVSSSSSLSYLSVAQSSSLEQRGSWKPRRRHAPPPTLPIHRRAKGYDDLFPFEVSQLASVLCHAPPVNTPRDGAVWAAYVCHTNERIALLGHKLRAATTLPSFLPWSTNHGLCSIHRHLNAKPLEDIFAALRYEVEVRTREVWQPVALAGALSASQTQQLALMEELRSLWLPPSEFMKKFGRLPAPRYAYQADGCVACMLSRMGANVETAMALGAMLLGSMRRSDMLSTRVCFCREWVRYTVEGDIDCVDAALAEMEMMGTKFREARKWARQRIAAMREQPERGFGLGSIPYAQPGRTPSRQGSATTVHQVSAQKDAAETLERQLDKRTTDGCHDHQGVAGASQQYTSQQLPLRPYASAPASPESHSFERLPAEPLPTQQSPADLHSPEQYYSAHNSPEPHHPPSEYSVPRTYTPKPSPPNSPTSLYSEFTINPFLDGSSSPSPIHNRNLPPDLPFRLFERRRAQANDGTPSPPKNAVQWPSQPPLTKQITAERFKDGLVPVPCLARLGKGDRSVGALWKRRAEKMVASGKK